jgi:hypothetical protein
MLILEWIVWVISASIAFGGICHMRADAKKGNYLVDVPHRV